MIVTQNLNDLEISSRRGVCSVCKQKERQYICPKCQVPYCSLDCYQKHSGNCTESFYRENVLGVLQSTHTTEEDKKNVLQMLARVHEKDILDQENAALMEKLSKLDLESEELFSTLSNEEQKTFINLIESGRASTLLDLWVPWWTKEPKQNLIEELNPGEDSPFNMEVDNPPKIKDPLPPLSSLSSKPPSPFLVYNLVDILFAYAYTLRYFNGDWKSDPRESAFFLYGISSVLNGNSVYETVSCAVSHVLERTLKSSMSGHNPPDFSVAVLGDVAEICQLETFVMAALSDIDNMFLCALETLPRKLKEHKKQCQTLLLAEKKITFYLSWTNSFHPTQLQPIALQVKMEQQKHQQNLLPPSKTGSPPTNLDIANTTTKPFIQEL